MLAHALAEWFGRLEAGGVAGGVDADALGLMVIHDDEHRDLAFVGPGGGHVGAPHGVQRVGDDGAVVTARPTGRADPRGRQQGVLAHQPEHPVPGGADTGEAQAALRWPFHQLRWRNLQASPPIPCDAPRRERDWRKGRPGSARPAPCPASTSAGPKGAHPPGQRPWPPAARARAASRPAWLSAARSRVLPHPQAGSSPAFTGRVARLASPAGRTVSRQPLSVAAVAPRARESVSRSSPRSSRSTASRLRCRDIRPPRPGPAASATVVVSVVIVHLCRGQRPVVRCLAQLRGAGG